MVLGAVWCLDDKKRVAFERLREIKKEHGFNADFELKWNKVSDRKLDYYLDVVNYYFDNDNLHFRAIVVPDKSLLDHAAFNQTHNDFYYKMYYSLIKTLLEPTSAYTIYIDIKDTQGSKKIKLLQEVLRTSTYDFNREIIKKIQLVSSKEIELVQLADFISGAIGYANRGLTTNEAKLKVIELIRKRAGVSLLQSTLYRADKMNILIWKSSKEQQ
jgi:hypothetical protein